MRSISLCRASRRLLLSSASPRTPSRRQFASVSTQCNGARSIHPNRFTTGLTTRTFSSTSRSHQQAASSTFTKPPTSSNPSAASQSLPPEETRSLTEGFSDEPLPLGDTAQVDWSRSFHGLSHSPFSKEAQEILLQPISPEDVEVKPDGIVYLPEIKYRRILNKAFGPGGWGLAPRGETIVTPKSVTREYGMIVLGRLVSIARGEQGYFDPEGIPTAAEGCKSNALMRCCKDLGVASELWDPRYIRKFLSDYTKEVWVEHVVTKKKKKITIRKDETPRYPFKEAKVGV